VQKETAKISHEIEHYYMSRRIPKPFIYKRTEENQDLFKLFISKTYIYSSGGIDESECKSNEVVNNECIENLYLKSHNQNVLSNYQNFKTRLISYSNQRQQEIIQNLQTMAAISQQMQETINERNEQIDRQYEQERKRLQEQAETYQIKSTAYTPTSYEPPKMPNLSKYQTIRGSNSFNFGSTYKMPPLPIIPSRTPSSLKYVGNLNNNQYDPNSISNQYGKYGSRYSNDSLNNPYGAGNPYKNKNIKLYDQEGNFRGNLNNNKYDINSISNPYGKYGSKYSQESINNPYGAGNQYNESSPNNPYGKGLIMMQEE
jgi:hypothetical protein